ncbi:hypothetical protein ACFL6C_10040 [Myxococcota bacterium]
MHKDICIALLAGVALASCGGGEHKVSFQAAGHAEFETGVRALSLAISDISISETGEEWTHIGSYGQSVSLEAGSSTELIVSDLPVGEYHGVKVEFDPGYVLHLDDGSQITGDRPDILMYIVGAIHRYSNSGNGFPDTNEYFMFTTRNGALASEIDVEDEDKSFLVFEFKPMGVPDVEFGLASRVTYTSFLY